MFKLMRYLKKFENINISDMADIKDLFQEIIDEWDSFDLSGGQQQANIYPAVKNTKIEYHFFNYKDLCDTDIRFIDSRFRNSKFDINPDYLLFLNLAGPNDFFRTRIEFLDDIKIFMNRLNVCGFNCDLVEHKEDSSKFLLFIYKQ